MGGPKPHRTRAADMSAAAEALLASLARVPDLLVAETSKTEANRLVTLGYARRLSALGQPLRVAITITGREKLGRKAS